MKVGGNAAKAELNNTDYNNADWEKLAALGVNMDDYKDCLLYTSEKVWNICYNEVLQKWVTFFSWVPSYSENIDNIVTLSTDETALTVFADCCRQIKAEYPEIHITSGLSNISFGLPVRKNINQRCV